jgi:hypothetical protein
MVLKAKSDFLDPIPFAFRGRTSRFRSSDCPAHPAGVSPFRSNKPFNEELFKNLLMAKAFYCQRKRDELMIFTFLSFEMQNSFCSFSLIKGKTDTDFRKSGTKAVKMIKGNAFIQSNTSYRKTFIW